MEDKKIIGYILMVEYPNCYRKVGEFEPYTTGEFSKYPDIWKPIFGGKIIQEEKQPEEVNYYVLRRINSGSSLDKSDIIGVTTDEEVVKKNTSCYQYYEKTKLLK